MSFWTNVVNYYPGRPPLISCGDLAQFVDWASSVEVCQSPQVGARIIWGDRVDADDLGFDEEVRTRYGNVVDVQYKRRRLDLELCEESSLHDLSLALETYRSKSVYRAHISLGRLRDDIARRFYVRYPENPQAVCPYDVSLCIEPILVGSLAGEESFFVSYIGLLIGGPGYCWPRTARQVIDCVRHDKDVASLVSALPRIWPAAESALTRLGRRLKHGPADLWPYDEACAIAAPSWVWGIDETG
jgi:hypothetical protein